MKTSVKYTILAVFGIVAVVLAIKTLRDRRSSAALANKQQPTP